MIDKLAKAGVTRMLLFGLLALVLMACALLVQSIWPASIVAVTLYKAHLLAVAGWGGYWLDRGLFPYARPHELSVPPIPAEMAPHEVPHVDDSYLGLLALGPDQNLAELRRALIVLGCLVCVGLGA